MELRQISRTSLACLKLANKIVERVYPDWGEVCRLQSCDQPQPWSFLEGGRETTLRTRVVQFYPKASSFFKSSVFRCLHENTKTAFFNISPVWREFLKSCDIGDRVHRIRVETGQIRKEKSCVFKRKRMRVNGT